MGWRDLFGPKQSKRTDAPADSEPYTPRPDDAEDAGLYARMHGSDEVLTRILALQALTADADQAARDIIGQSMKGPWRSVRIVAAEAAVRLMSGIAIIGDVGEISPDLLAARRRAMANLESELLTRYVLGLQHADAAVRLAAAEVLGETANAAASAPLVAALADADMSVVSQATESLVQLGDIGAPALREGARSPNKMVRDSAMWCLAQGKGA